MIQTMKSRNLWYTIDSQKTKGKYKQGDTIKLETETVKSSLCDYPDAFKLVTGNITAAAADNNTNVAFKNSAPFSTCTTRMYLLTKKIIFTLQCLCTI